MSDYSAVFNCPGCGSPLQTPEGTISLSCSYCGLIMRIGSPGRILKYLYNTSMDTFAVKFSVERYLKTKGLSLKYTELGSNLYHLPFYRFRGMSYSLFREQKFEEYDDPEIPPTTPIDIFEQKCRNFDLTIPAYDNTQFGLESLGIRPEVMPLTAMFQNNFPEESISVDITLTPEQAREKAMGFFFFNLGNASCNKELVSSEMVGEGLSVIYYPVWSYCMELGGMKSTLFIDGLNKRVYNEAPGEYYYRPSDTDFSGASEINPVSHKCPNCGFNLPTSECSLFYYCANCRRSYMIHNDSYLSAEARGAVYENGEYYHPFWRFPFAAGDKFNTVSEFSRILTGEIPLVARKKAENLFYLYAPAFKTADLGFLTSIGTAVCRIQPELNKRVEGFDRAAEMILPESEALELARHYWDLMRHKYRYLTGPDYHFNSCRLGPGELYWLSLSRPCGSPGSDSYSERKQAKKNRSYA